MICRKSRSWSPISRSYRGTEQYRDHIAAVLQKFKKWLGQEFDLTGLKAKWPTLDLAEQQHCLQICVDKLASFFAECGVNMKGAKVAWFDDPDGNIGETEISGRFTRIAIWTPLR